MVATSRLRNRESDWVHGEGKYFSSPVERSYPAKRERSEDVIGDFGGNHYLYLSKVEASGSFLSLGGPPYNLRGSFPSGMYTRTGEEWTSGVPALSSYINQILSRSGPMSPNVHLPLFLYELKDIPRMLQHAGNLLHGLRRPSGLDPIREAAAANLAYKFGWAPIIQDIGKLLDFSDSVRKQQRRIAKAHTSRGVSRRISLGTLVKPVQGQPYVWSTQGIVQRQSYSGSATTKTWATVNWIVRDPNKYGYEPSFNEAFRASIGLSGSMIPVQIWKAMPWTWAIDWFTDISNVLQANGNMINYRPRRLSIMRTQYVVQNYRQVKLVNYKLYGNEFSAGTVISTYKRRYANNSPSTNVTLRLPFMDSFKTSVLASLFYLRATRGR